MNNDTRQNAIGRWRAILLQFGFTEKELSGKHGPCPLCEGTDRFRYTDYKDGGEYYCSSCGAGSGFDLIMKKFGYPFSEAAKEVDRILGQNIEPVFKPQVNIEKRRSDLNRVWKEADAPKVLDRYLMGRGIQYRHLPDLRGHSALSLVGGMSEPADEAMVALIRNKDGIPVSIHRTYINLKQRKIMPPTETIKGAGIRLGSMHGDALVVGEGIETTLSGMETFLHPGIASISAYGMEELFVPEQYKSIIIIADNDFSFTGQKAAFTLARRLDNEKAERKVNVVMLSEQGMDFNDPVTDDSIEVWEWGNGRS